MHEGRLRPAPRRGWSDDLQAQAGFRDRPGSRRSRPADRRETPTVARAGRRARAREQRGIDLGQDPGSGSVQAQDRGRRARIAGSWRRSSAESLGVSAPVDRQGPGSPRSPRSSIRLRSSPGSTSDSTRSRTSRSTPSKPASSGDLDGLVGREAQSDGPCIPRGIHRQVSPWVSRFFRR